jgi:CubicO group peptidase (beta-lactamase class C family)
MLIARGEEIVYEQALGMQDAVRGVPMSTDTIFRIYSMTKPVVSVAVMTMVEEGRLLLNDPVSKYLPELKDLKRILDPLKMKDTGFWIDPQEKVIAIFLIQAPEHLDYYKTLFRNLVYGAML